jgi:hypothetical protein
VATVTSDFCQTLLGAGQANLRHAGADRDVAAEEGRATCSAGLLAIIVGERQALLRDPVDVASGPSGNNYQDGMVEHDMHVGQLLKLLDDLGIANNTIVLYSRAAIGPI